MPIYKNDRVILGWLKAAYVADKNRPFVDLTTVSAREHMTWDAVVRSANRLFAQGYLAVEAGSSEMACLTRDGVALTKDWA